MPPRTAVRLHGTSSVPCLPAAVFHGTAWLPGRASPAAPVLRVMMYLSSVGAKVFDTSEK